MGSLLAKWASRAGRRKTVGWRPLVRYSSCVRSVVRGESRQSRAMGRLWCSFECVHVLYAQGCCRIGEDDRRRRLATRPAPAGLGVAGRWSFLLDLPRGLELIFLAPARLRLLPAPSLFDAVHAAGLRVCLAAHAGPIWRPLNQQAYRYRTYHVRP